MTGIFACEPLFLASASPRRSDILKMAGLGFTPVPVDIVEFIEPPVETGIKAVSMAKAEAAVARYGIGRGVVLGCDTVVCLGNYVLGKPKDKAEARDMLSRLQNNKHTVISGICLLNSSDGRYVIDAVATDVYMGPIAPGEISAYVDTGEPMDKAGSYAIQGLAGRFVRRIEGCFYNVMGLPLSRMFELSNILGGKSAAP